jgi:hypothetical protein
LIGAVAILGVVVYVTHTPRRVIPEEGLILDEPWANGRIQNGWAYDRAVLALPEGAVLVVPGNVRVERSGSESRVEVFIEKHLGYHGYLNDPLSIQEQRRFMGVARKDDAKKVQLSTYGEWNSNFEGGASVLLLIRVPAGVQVNLLPIPAPKRGREFTIPTAVALAPGWQALSVEPDPRFTARR